MSSKGFMFVHHTGLNKSRNPALPMTSWEHDSGGKRFLLYRTEDRLNEFLVKSPTSTNTDRIVLSHAVVRKFPGRNTLVRKWPRDVTPSVSADEVTGLSKSVKISEVLTSSGEHSQTPPS